MDTNPSITKTNTIETFMKARTDLRVGTDAIAYFLAELDKLGERVVQQASKTAQAEKRTTLLEKDIKAALDSFLGGSDLSSLFKRLEQISAKDTAQIAKMIEQWLKDP